MYYTIYHITNTANGKIYIGKHQTKNLDDGYMGSGKALRRALAKYGSENFTKKILYVFDTEEAMNAKEAELVTEEFCSSTDNYNLCVGGKGGWSFIHREGLHKQPPEKTVKHPKVVEGRNRYNQSNTRQYWETGDGKGVLSKENLAKVSERNKRRNAVRGSNVLNSPSAMERKKQKFKENSHQRGERNSQFGTMWITNGKMNRKVSKLDTIEIGWYKGRI